MRRFKLLTLFVASLFAANMWAAISLGDGTGLEWQLNTVELGQPEKALVITYDGVGSGVMPDYSVLSGPYSYPGWNSSAENIVSISLPDGLKNISKQAFLNLTNSALTELTIPASVTSIGNQAIGITYLESLICNPTTAPTLGVNSLYAHAENFSIIYPCGSGESYVNNWTSFYSYLTPAEPCSEPKPAFNPSGDCGTNAHYSFNGSTGVLTISGTGETDNTYSSSTIPWYSYSALVTSVVVEEGITTIGQYFFSGLTNLSSVSLPSTLTAINKNAFSSCSTLTSITIPTGVTTLGSSAFASCSQLASVSLPSTLTTIDTYAFQNAGLTSITFPASASNLTIGNNAFQGASLATVIFAEGSKVTSIGNNAFRDITGLTEITIPASVSSIGNWAFRSCSDLATVHVERTTPPTGGTAMFRDVPTSSLQIFVPSEAVDIYKETAGWSTYASYIKAEGGDVPANACGENLTWEYADGVLTISGTGDMSDYTSGAPAPWNANAANITSIVLPNGITSIGNYAFYGCSNASLTSITIPSSVETIGVRAFQGCHSLTAVTIPSGVTEIGERAFNGLWAVETINVLATTPPTLGEAAMNTNTEVETFKITVPDANAQAYADAWVEYWLKLYKATSGEHVPAPNVGGDFGEGNTLHWALDVLDDKLEVLRITGSGSTGGITLGAAPWEAYKEQIRVVYLPVGITYMGFDDFYGHNVEKVYLPANPADLTWDEDGDDFIDPYDHDPKATICYVPDEYKDAYIEKFQDVNVTFKGESEEGAPEPVAEPNGLSWTLVGGVLTFTYDGEGTGIMEDYTIATEGSNPRPWHDSRASITSVVLPEGLKYIGNWAFYGFRNNALTSITIPSTVTSIGKGAFADCTGLTSVTIPANVTSIGIQAFEGCTGLTSVIIPANVTEIGAYAFDRCANLATVTCLPTTAPTVGDEAFDACHANLVITYPDGSDQDYANKFLQSWDYLRNASTSVQPATPHLHATFGDANLEWDLSFTGSGTLLEHAGTLAITGSGAMDDYNWKVGQWAPWHDYENYIQHVNIGSGVTKIGISAFADMKHVNTFIIPASVTYIGGDAFFGCNNTEMIVYSYANPANLEWHDNSFGYEGVGWVPDDFLSLTRGPWGNSVFVSQATKCVVPSNYLDGYKAKWARGGDYKWWDLNVWFASELQDGESAEYITNALNELDGKVAPVVTLVRPLNRDGYFATLCLPFNMSASQIAESSLHSAEIKEFTGATVEGGTLNIEFTPVTEIVAGRPYFVKYTDPEALGDALDRLDFMEVTIDKTAPVAVTHGGLTMTGTYVPKAVSVQTSATDGDGVLFLGANNSLYWPNVAGNIKPFRAYFSIAGSGPGMPKKGMPARIVEKEQTPTAINNTTADRKYSKTLENGMLLIEKNGTYYNAQGQIVK